jgi:hypothetical protein
LLEKLAALVPPPRFNLVRYHGVLAPAARRRAEVVPCDSGRPHGRESCRRAGTRPVRLRNYTWAQLMARVFEVDALRRARCGSRLRILADIHTPNAIRAILDCLGLPSRAPPIAAAREEESGFRRW